VGSKYVKVLIWKITPRYGFDIKKKKSLMEDKENARRRGHLSESQKAHLTGEFVVVMKIFGCALLHLGSMPANVVSE